MADAAVKTPRIRKPKATGIFADAVLVKWNVPKTILDQLQAAADEAILPLDIFCIKALAGTLVKE